MHSWVTHNGQDLLPGEEENCSSGPLEITDEDVAQSVRSIPRLASLILVKAMLRKHSFQHPFKSKSIEFGTCQRAARLLANQIK